LGLLLVLLAIGLLCKFDYKVKVVKKPDENWQYDVRIKWLFGLIKRSMKSDNEIAEKTDAAEGLTSSTPSPEPETKTENRVNRKSKKKHKEKKGASRFKNLNLDSILRIVGYTLNLLKKLFAAFRPRRIVVRGRYGASSPDVTGKVLAAIYAASAALNIRTNVSGDFENEILILDIRAMGYFRLWAVIVPAVRYILRPEIWRLLFPKRSKQEKIERRKTKKEAKKIKREAKRKKLEVDENGHRI